MHSRFSLWVYLLIAIAVMAMAAGIELGMGRRLISQTGVVKLWVGDVNSAENSQQVFDWYSFTHVTHGILFYALLRWVNRGKWPVGACLLAVILVETSWEVFENTSFTIERYRAATMALGYYGDTVLNSMSDIFCCGVGFFLAWRLPVWVTVGLVVVLEVGLLLVIRDNLLLNIIMLIWPIQAIKHWQMGVGIVLGWQK